MNNSTWGHIHTVVLPSVIAKRFFHSSLWFGSQLQVFATMTHSVNFPHSMSVRLSKYNDPLSCSYLLLRHSCHLRPNKKLASLESWYSKVDLPCSFCLPFGIGGRIVFPSFPLYPYLSNPALRIAALVDPFGFYCCYVHCSC
jgi:hypothetical protein